MGCCTTIPVVSFTGLDIVTNVLLTGGEEVGPIPILGVTVVCVSTFIIIGAIINNKKV